MIKDNEEAHRKAGHWGVPTFAFNGEPFFGQDRIDALLWRLEQHGLKRRSVIRPTSLSKSALA